MHHDGLELAKLMLAPYEPAPERPSARRRRGIIHKLEPFRIGSSWYARAVVNIDGILISRVVASPKAVLWPSSAGEQVIRFEDADLQARAEAALRQAARDLSQSMRRRERK